MAYVEVEVAGAELPVARLQVEVEVEGEGALQGVLLHVVPPRPLREPQEVSRP
jgi:hypothetical protein